MIIKSRVLLILLLLAMHGHMIFAKNNGGLSGERENTLIDCIKTNDIKTLQALLKDKITVNFVDKDFMTPLIVAVKNNNLEVTKLLIESGAEIDLDKQTDGTPLMWAAYGGHEELVTYLLHQKAKPGFNKGVTPLNAAVQNGHLGVIEKLIKAGADVNQIETHGITPLITCSLLSPPKVKELGWNRIKEMILLLLQNGADINFRDKIMGLTVLNHFCFTAPYEIVKLLVDNGADVNNMTKCKSTPLHSAVFRMKPEGRLVKLLLEQGATLNIENRYGRTPLYAAVVNYEQLTDKKLKDSQQEIVLMLLNHGADIQHVNRYGKTVLDKTKSKSMYKLLRKYGAEAGKK